MPDSTKGGRAAKSSRLTSPEDFPTSPLQPSGDYSYTLEIVMRMQETMGLMRKAIDALESETREHRAKLDSIGRDVHSAKVLFAVLGSILAACGTGAIALLGIGLNFYMNVHKH